MKPCFVGLGSNLGERRAMLLAAVAGLQDSGVLKSVELSGLYESPALLPPDAPEEWNIPYLNAVLKAQTRLDPHELLSACQAQELALGKAKIGHWAPRAIDIDVLDYDSEVVATESLALPHPHLHLRDFVLLPWQSLAPDWCHPLLGLTVEELLAMLPQITAKRYFGA